ncbi:hypothetical protein SteCoe_17773 [Stentor coeruleus]|uniref:Ion transport domain-containing protein n=1 Tax=Stentor coeruleus TaxID=5963 RepID=A0A1R2BY34_9CILI|nr:hypothetical protein SteCoe_17773 [Stentor coeruleus]
MFSSVSYKKVGDSKGVTAPEFLESMIHGLVPLSNTISFESEPKILKSCKNLLIVGLKNAQVVIYDIISRLKIVGFSTQQTKLYSLTLDQSEMTIFTSGQSSNIYTWSSTGDLLSKTQTNHKARICYLFYNNSFLYSADTLGNISITSKDLSKFISGHNSKIPQITFCHNLATCSIDFTIKIWDNTLNLLGTLTSTKPIHIICYLNSNRLASAGFHALFCIWNIKTYTLEKIVNIEERWISSLCKCPNDDNLIVAGTSDCLVQYFHIGKEVFEESFTAHEMPIRGLCFNTTGSILISCSLEKSAKLWPMSREIPKNKTIQIVDVKITSCLTNIQEDSVFIGDEEGKIHKWDLETLGSLGAWKAHSESITGLGFNNNDLVSISHDGSLKVWTYSKLINFIPIKEALWSICITTEIIYVGSSRGHIHFFDKKYVKIKIVNAHSSPVSSITAGKTIFASAGLDKKIVCWDLKRLEITYSFEAHDKGIKNITIHPDSKRLISFCNSPIAKVWYPGDPPVDVKLFAHTSNITSICFTNKGDYFFTGDNSGNLILWCGNQLLNLCIFTLKSPIISLHDLPLRKRILIVTSSKIYILFNFLTERHLMTYPNYQSYLFIHYFSNIISSKQPDFKVFFKDYIILPYKINILHAFAYKNDYQNLKLAFSAGVKFFASEGYNPLRVALDRKSYQSIDVIIKYIPIIYEKSNPHIFYIIEKEIVELLQISLKNIPNFLQKAFPVVKIKYAPTFAKNKNKKIFTSEIVNINIKAFDLGDNGKVPIEFHESAFRLNLELGSKQCRNLVRKISQCTDSTIFDQLFIQTILDYLYRKALPFMIFEAIFGALSIIFFLIYMQIRTENMIFGIVLIFFNIIHFICEIMQLFINPGSYFNDFWNCIDMCKIITTLLACVFILVDWHDDITQNLMSLAVLFSALRIISLMRMISITRSMIRMIVEVIKNIIEFLLILFVTTLIVAASFWIIQENMSFTDVLMSSFMINFGQFNIEDASKIKSVEWELFLFTLFLNPLVMMNLLIATMGDTYSNIQTNLISSNYREIANVIDEASIFLFFNWNNNRLSFLQLCSVREHQIFESSLQAKMKKIKNSFETIQNVMVENNRKIEFIMDKLNN